MRQFVDKYLLTNNFAFDDHDIHISCENIKGSVTHCYNTLDSIDNHLISNGTPKISCLIEHANLSAMVGNLLGSGFVLHSNGFYLRNKPHMYPDLIPKNPSYPGIEIKTSFRKNPPKGHQPKSGYYLTYRYLLTNEQGSYSSNIENLDTVTIWEIKFGYLQPDDFSCSNTPSDSGKTASIKINSLNKMKLLYLDPTIVPYQHSQQKPYKGYN